jgi:adenylate kinase
VVLKADLATVLQRNTNDPDRSRSQLEVLYLFMKFQSDRKFVNFARTAHIKEICINTIDRNAESIAKEIVEELS